MIIHQTITGKIRTIFAVCFLVLCGAAGQAKALPALPEDRHSAVIFAYSMIGEDSFPEQSIRLSQFEEHMRELQEEDYNVLSLGAVVNAFKSGAELPERAVVITFDGIHESVIRKAVPVLERYGFPYTVFVATDRAAMNEGGYMSWSDIKSLTRNKNVTIGLHTASYRHIAAESPEAIKRDINRARSMLRENTGTEAAFFSYPFGEYDAAFRAIIEEQDFKAAAGQNSGVAYSESDMLALPRFVMTEEYGDLGRFRMLANALPLPVQNVTPSVTYLEDRKPNVGFSLTPELAGHAERLSCFASGQDKPEIETIGENRVELRLRSEFMQERGRINCTMPVKLQPHEETRWRWFGMLLAYPSRM